jgi:hypothetical protein
MGTKVKDRTTTRPFKSKYPGRCPLGPEGVHPIHVGDTVIKITPGLQWSEEYSKFEHGRSSHWVGVARTEYVHEECYEKKTA